VNALVFHHRQVAFLERFGFQVVSKCEEKDQPTFFTLVFAPIRANPVHISARGSVVLDEAIASATLTRKSITRDSNNNNSNNNDKDIVDL
jgi:hypothetical protein